MTRDEALQLLDLRGTPTPQQVRDAYRNTVKQAHPDQHPNADDYVRKLLQERFQLLGEARDILLSFAGSTSDAGTRSENSVPEDLEDVHRMIGRRQFSLARERIESLIARHGEKPLLLHAQLEVLAAMDDHAGAYEVALRLRQQDSALASDPDFLHHSSLLALLAGLSREALRDVQRAQFLSESTVPTFIETEARIRIRQGETSQADQLIRRLASLDPHNDLVLEREQVWNIAGSYVGKKEASQSACAACVLLELIFDCI